MKLRWNDEQRNITISLGKTWILAIRYDFIIFNLNVNFYSLLFKMKKYLCIVVLSILLTLFVWQSFAVNISPANKSKVDSLIAVVEQQKGSESLAAQLVWYEKMANSLSRTMLEDWDQKEMIEYLLEYFQQKISVLKSQVITQNEIIWNVDWDKVKQERLSWHNYERSQKWLSPYTYNESLNYTALTWAQQIANEQRKTWGTHVRQAWDGYYKTESIKNRFSNLWVNVVYFSESNAYWYYSCSKSDCTQEMIDALKKCFTRTFLNKGHYPAVVSSTYDQIWVWVAKNWNYIRVTTHYGVNVK